MAIAYTYDEPNVPRDPNEYRPDEHMIIKKWQRNVDGWIIEYLIRHGRIESKGDGRYVFREELQAPDPDSFENRTDEWIMPVQLKPNESKHIVTTSPYIMGINNDELVAEINPYEL